MNNFDLKQKLAVDKTVINDLIAKSWQESDNIQTQIESIEQGSDLASKTVLDALNGLLTSYYVFAGRLESLLTDLDKKDLIDTDFKKINDITEPAELDISLKETEPEIEKCPNKADKAFEPFEYFVDFDEPDLSQPKLTDEDLYN